MSLDHKIAEVRTLLDTVQADYAPATFANSFGAEDMVLMDLIARHYPDIACLRWIPDACRKKPTA